MNATQNQSAESTAKVDTLLAASCYQQALAVLDRSGGNAPAQRLLRVRALQGLERWREAQEFCRAVANDPASTRSEALQARVEGARILLSSSPLVDEALELAVDTATEAAQLAAREGSKALQELAGLARLEAVHGFARKRCRNLAGRELLAARKLLGDDARTLVVAGRLLLAFDERALARERFTAAVGNDANGRRLGLLGLCLVDALAGDFERAHTHLDALQPLQADDREARRTRLRLFLAEGRWADVLPLLDELIAGSPEADTTPADRYLRAVALYQSGQRDAAAKAWLELAAAHPTATHAQAAARNTALLGRPAAATLARKRLAAFPSVAQLQNHCGPAAVELYLRFFGVPAEQLAVARAIKLSPVGTPIYRMRSFLESAGFATRRIEADLPQLRRLLDAGIPVIMEEDYSTSRHVAVAIGYDDALEVLAVQDPMSHEVRETPYEQLTKLRGLANHGALVAVPRAEESRLSAAGAEECRYISLVDEAWAAKDAGSAEAADRLVDEAVSLRIDYELAWLYRFHREREKVAAVGAGAGDASAYAPLRALVAEIEKLWPDDEWPQQLVGEVLCAERRPGEALRAFEKARDRDPADARNWVRIAECHLAAGQEDHAHEALTQSLRLDASHPRANEFQAWQYLRLGRGTLALLANEVARELMPSNPLNHSMYATLLAGRGELDQAIAAYSNAHQLAPAHLPFLVERARLQARLGRVDEAVQDLAAAARQRPREISIRVHLAELLYRHGRAEAALSVCDELRAIDEKHHSAYALGGASLCAIGKLDEGIAELQKALQLQPTFTWALAELGHCLGRAGRHAEAVHACAAAVGLSGLPSHTLSLAQQLLAAGVSDEAVRRARSAAASGRLTDDEWPRAVEVLVAGAGLRATHQLLAELERNGAPSTAQLRVHAHLLFERSWAPALARDVLGRLAAVAPENAFVLAAQGAALMDGAPATHAQGEQLLRSAIAKEPTLACPRRLLAHRLSGRGRFAEALELLQACPEDFVDVEQRLFALLGLGKVAEAEAIVAAFAAAQAPGAETQVGTSILQFRLAHHRADWQAALTLSEQISRAHQEDEGDSRLGTWEEAKFACLLSLGELDRARHFGEQQAGDAASAARLSRTALGCQCVELAAHFAAIALQQNADEPLAQQVQAAITKYAPAAKATRRDPVSSSPVVMS